MERGEAPSPVRGLVMRSLVLLLPLALSSTACQGPQVQRNDGLIPSRERELQSLDEKRKNAIFDLSGIQPSNGENAYLNEQSQRRSR